MQIFQQNVIAMVWDFDRTLIRGHMQVPLLDDYGVDPSEFWREVDALPARHAEHGVRVARDSAYLNHLLTGAWDGRFPGLTNERLRSYGERLEFYPGMPEFMQHIDALIADDPRYRRHEIHVEHYVVSTGLRQIIEGSAIRPRVKDVWASEFIEGPAAPGGGAVPGVVTQIGYMIDNTTKTRALFEINKGVNVEPGIDVNGVMAEHERRVPFTNMICVADGPSDVPMFSVVNSAGGKSFAVYDPTDERHFGQVSLLVEQERVIASFPADYREGTSAWLWLHRAVRQVADEIEERLEAALRRATMSGPRHLSAEPLAEPADGPPNGAS